MVEDEFLPSLLSSLLSIFGSLLMISSKVSNFTFSTLLFWFYFCRCFSLQYLMWLCRVLKDLDLYLLSSFRVVFISGIIQRGASCYFCLYSFSFRSLTIYSSSSTFRLVSALTQSSCSPHSRGIVLNSTELQWMGGMTNTSSPDILLFTTSANDSLLNLKEFTGFLGDQLSD